MVDSHSDPVSPEPSEQSVEKASTKSTSAKSQGKPVAPMGGGLIENVSNDLNPDPKPVYNKLFLDAVDDAQYMLAYAASNTNIKIGTEIISTLVNTKHLVNAGKQVGVELQSKFWTAYQDLWELVKPATAETIKANLPLEKTFFGILVDKIPGVSRWLGARTISKARKAVNRYVFFTVFILILVMFFQVYWVIGNQLSVQLDRLLEEERDLSIQISENAQVSAAIPTQIDQDSAEIQTTGLEKKLQSLESQLVQTSMIFLNWSSPWNQLTTNGELDRSGKYDSQLSDIDTRLAEIDLQLRLDPEGMKAAMASEAGLRAQIDEENPGENKKDMQDKLNMVQKKKTIETILASLNEKEAVIQSQKQDQIKEKSRLEQELIRLEGAKILVQEELNNQRTALEQDLDNKKMELATLEAAASPTEAPQAPEVSSENEAAPVTDVSPETEATSVTEALPATDTTEIQRLTIEQESIEAQIGFIDNLSGSSPNFDSSAVNLNSDLAAQVKQLEYILAEQRSINEKLEIIKPHLEPVDLTAIKGLDELKGLLENTGTDISELQGKIDAIIDTGLPLQEQLTGLSAARNLLQAHIEDLQDQIDSIEINPETSSKLNKELAIVADTIVEDLYQEQEDLAEEREKLRRQAQMESIRENYGPAQLAGRFVLDILQNYLLPLLYGVLGASIYVLRSLSRHITNVTYSEVPGIRHVVHIALGALAGILVGWFSFLLPSDNIIGSVSPLAIAFLVGYNIELVFTKMDEFVVTRVAEIRQRSVISTKGGNQVMAAPNTLPEKPKQNPSEDVPAPEVPVT